MKLISLKRLIILIVSCNPGWAASWTAINTGLPTTITAVRTLTIDPATPSTLYVCSSTGRVYKSTNGGRTWEFMGLKETQHIGRIVVHPRDAEGVEEGDHGLCRVRRPTARHRHDEVEELQRADDREETVHGPRPRDVLVGVLAQAADERRNIERPETRSD